MADDPRIDALCRSVGIASSYLGGDGQTHHASRDSKRFVLEALGVDVSSDAAVAESVERAKASTRRPLPPLVTIAAGADPIKLHTHEPVQWRLQTEAGDVTEGRSADAALSLGDVPPGYHALTLQQGSEEFDTTLVAAPQRCFMPEAFVDGDRAWGVTAQVYGLRGPHDIGIGTYADVETLAGEVGSRGGAFLGLSPVHALFGADTSKYSPYSPSSRLFLQTGLIAPHDVPGFDAALHGHEPVDAPGALIDYSRVLAKQRAILAQIWDATKDAATGAMAAFRREGGERLEGHATFEALCDHFKRDGMHWLGEWPAAFRDGRTADVAHFRRDHPDEVAFHVWLQWLADGQLGRAAARARDSGMAIGLYRDLAVGADRGGSEVWSAPERFVGTLSVGAPPDPLGPLGQDWGLPPLNPVALASSRLAAFRDLVTANMRHAGALRIDHAFQLQRLFVMPVGGTPTDGVYLSYPLDALLASLKIESHRARCLIIGEDLGTAPDGFSDAIMDAGMLSYRLLPFERESDGAFKAPTAYPSSALAALSTHDLPTFAGWWRGLDNDVRECLGVYDAARARHERDGRARDRQELVQALHAEGLAADAQAVDRAPEISALRYLSRTPCALVAVQIEDILREQQQANLPGPDCGHPNWRRRYATSVDRISAHPGLDRIAAAFRREGRGGAQKPAASNIPRATYRLQLHKDFTFDDAARVVPYLAELGVSHVYVSPIQMASPGSTHGYDVVDPSRLNPELGGDAGFRRFSDMLAAHHLSLLVDIVPNHVGVGGKDNPWWLDLLEWGRQSPRAKYFDVDWEKPGADGKLIVPFLGDPLDDVLAKGGLTLGFDAGTGRLAVWYADHCHPVLPSTYGQVLRHVRAAGQENDASISELARGFDALADCARTDPQRAVACGRALQKRLATLCKTQPMVQAAIESAAKSLSIDALRALCDEQCWRLTHWKLANEHINYRRFFDITSLAGVRVEDADVFEASGRVIFDLIEEGRIQGLRLDHVDGLADPAGYMERLQERVGPDFFVVVEKILEPGEHLPAWPIAGTTGYDALHTLDSIFFARDAVPTLDQLHAQVLQGTPANERALFAIKADLATGSFQSEFSALSGDLAREMSVDGDALQPALRALLAAFPVYRTYGTGNGFSAADERALAEARKVAAERLSPSERTTLDAVIDVLGRGGRALRRFQQLTGPLMAKSFEDTLFYRDARFIAANEVGCGPEHPGVSVREFHRANTERAHDWPGSLLATATHDTKRGEDARGRLLAASHAPAQWQDAWARFRAQAGADRLAAPDLYFLFQSLIAACPTDPADVAPTDFAERAGRFVEKFLREGKLRSSWTEPDGEYEAAVRDFAKRCASPDGILFGELAPFVHAIALAGARIGVARTVLKCTVPGVPDIYQGSESADLAFVDPDNRRPVDYERRRDVLTRYASEGSVSLDDRTLLAGDAKTFAIARLLRDRRDYPQTYRGSYQPIATSDDGVALGFQRGDGPDSLLVFARQDLAPGTGDASAWNATVPAGEWRNLFDGRTLQGDATLDGHELLGGWPAAAMRRVG